MANEEKAVTEQPKKKHTKAKVITILILVAVIIAAALIINNRVQKHRDEYFCQYSKKFSVSKVENAKNVALVAHRGYSAEAPENTIPAYVEAAKKGYKFVECDIMVTKDDVWVVSHDDNLIRMTGFDGEIKDMTLEEVQSHPLTEGANIKKYEGLVTPTFEEWCKTLKKYNLYPVIEMKLDDKDAPYEDVLKILDKYDLRDKTTFISFEEEPMEALRKLDPNVRMQWLVDELSEEAIAYAKSLNAVGIDVDFNSVLANPDLARKVRNEGMDLNVWTVLTKEDAEKSIAAGANYLTVNGIYPDDNEINYVNGLVSKF